MRNLPLRSLLLAACFAGLGGCADAVCDADHASAVAARALSQQDLARLFSEAETVARSRPSPYENVPVKTPLPKFALSPPTFRGYTDRWATVKLAGCFDHGVYLSLEELNTPQGNIELTWGEGPTSGSRVLWTRRSTP